ncbi:GH25308 [Drosophila grimshawi]|uniref:GH25308 n=1 Tax=Drosophila grimshawi TaxID=7222 RepID=B4K289_DROGR|nr:GH25308 [Drosophila grimshawi]
MDECPVLNGSGIAGVAATATGAMVEAITMPAPTTTVVGNNDVRIIEDDLFDLDSEITNVDEDEDNRLSADELQKKLDNILPKADGIFIEALESAQNDICGYQEALESMDDEKHAKLNNEQTLDDKEGPDEEPQSANPTVGTERAAATAEPMEVMMPSWKPPSWSQRIIRRSIQSRMRMTRKVGLARSCQKMCLLPVKDSVERKSFNGGVCWQQQQRSYNHINDLYIYKFVACVA